MRSDNPAEFTAGFFAAKVNMLVKRDIVNEIVSPAWLMIIMW